MNYMSSNGQQYTLHQIRIEQPHMSIPEGADLSDIGYWPIETTTPPTPGANEIIVPGEPEEYEPGKWRETWVTQAAPFMPLTPRQIRLALTQIGQRTAVEAAVAAGDQDLQDWWEFSLDYQRTHPLVIAMIDGLGITAEEADELWRVGATL